VVGLGLGLVVSVPLVPPVPGVLFKSEGLGETVGEIVVPVPGDDSVPDVPPVPAPGEMVDSGRGVASGEVVVPGAVLSAQAPNTEDKPITAIAAIRERFMG
jgi:hypothetical protein